MAPRMMTSPVWSEAPCGMFASCCCVLVMTDVCPQQSAVLSVCLLWFDWMRHVLRPDPFVELLRGQEARLQRRFPKSEILAVGFERNLRSFLVANVRIERRHQHQRVVEVLADALFIRLDAFGATIIKGTGTLCQKLNRLQNVVQDYRLVDIELEVSLRAGEGHGVIVAEHLNRHHG